MAEHQMSRRNFLIGGATLAAGAVVAMTGCTASGSGAAAGSADAGSSDGGSTEPITMV